MENQLLDDLRHAVTQLRKDGFFRFQSGVYRRIEEADDARTALEAMRIAFSEFQQSARGDDPPDCTCLVGGELWGVEVTELVHNPTMQMRVKGDHGLHHEWSDREILSALGECISRKDTASPKGGPFARYLLVIRTEEMHLDFHRMSELLASFHVECRLISDACLAYSYHPITEAPSDRPDYPVVRISINHRR